MDGCPRVATLEKALAAKLLPTSRENGAPYFQREQLVNLAIPG